MYSTILMIHLLGAAMTGVQSIRATISLIQGGTHAEKYRGLATGLASLGMFTIGTGTLLAILSTTISAASLCGNVVMYLATVFVVEFALFYKLNQLKQPLPVAVTVSRLALGIAPFCFALLARV